MEQLCVCTHGSPSLGVFLVSWSLCGVAVALPSLCPSLSSPRQGWLCRVCLSQPESSSCVAPQLGGHSPWGAAARPTAGLSPLLCLAVPHIVTANPSFPSSVQERKGRKGKFPSSCWAEAAACTCLAPETGA